ncbi:MAG: hypothetical protein SGJ02_09555 [bacterium]|nr:hypothetical protein [bacterium]
MAMNYDNIQRDGLDNVDQKKMTYGSMDTQRNGSGKIAENSTGVTAGESGEGTLTKQIESFTSKIPSATFLGLAVGSVGLSAVLRLFGNKDDSQFVGQWVPTILLLGLYNKLVKLEGSE